MHLAIILNMYGVIVKQTGDDFVPYVQQTFPQLKREEICRPWFKADVGELTSLEVWATLGFQGDLEQIEKEYLDTIELNDDFPEFIKAVSKRYNSISGDLKMQKPDERIFRLTVEQLGVEPEECLYVDDRRRNLAAAQSLGVKAVMLNSRNVEWDGDVVQNFEELVAEVL